MEKKKVVIFGATGNTGSYLVEYLKENFGYEVDESWTNDTPKVEDDE